MKEVIKEYKSRPKNNDFKLIQSIVKILSNEENVTLERAFKIISEFKGELKRLENRLFASSVDYKSIGKDL